MLHSISFVGFASFAVLGAATPARATIRYDVSLSQASQHIAHVTMTIPNAQGAVTVQMPAWDTLYQIRDFAYRVSDLHATGPASGPLAVSRLDAQTWRVAAPAGAARGDVRIEYNSFWDDPGPFGTQLNGQHAFLNLAMILCYVPDRRAEDAEVAFTSLPPAWHVAAELSAINKTNPASGFAAASYDALVDAPVEIGQFDELHFQAGGRPIRVVLHGDSVDHAEVTDTITRIVNYETKLMGDAPFPEYMFLYHVGRGFGGGGMEHANSTAISIQSEEQLPDVTAHEFFHLWNVKRIRPQSLEPVDHVHEMWTRSLWFAEGVTDTYATFTLVRTGLWSKGQYFEDLATQISDLQSRPARAWESAEESSLDAWFEKYPLYDRPDLSISYYNKGQLLGLALDITLRQSSDNRVSLDDVMRRMNDKYAHAGRFYPESAAVRETAEEVLQAAAPGKKADLALFFSDYVSGTKEIPFDDLFAAAGLRLVRKGQTRTGAPAYAVEEIAHPSESQQRILNGMLQGTTSPAGTSPAKK